jgi:hypothetical protein
MRLRWLVTMLFLSLSAVDSRALEFSQAEWNNPSQAGSSLWLKNRTRKPVTIKAIYVRDKGFKVADEIALTIGTRKYFFVAEKVKRGQWTRLRPRDKKKIRLRAKDSVMVLGFEYGSRLKAKKQSRLVSEEYVLDLKLVDSAGDSSIVKVSESATKYYINGNAPAIPVRAYPAILTRSGSRTSPR